MKTFNLKPAFIMIFFLSILVVGCKKNATDTTTADQASQARVQSSDAATVQGETDGVDDDANNSAAASERFCGAGNVFNTLNPIPDGTATLPSSSTAAAKIVIIYNGTAVGCRKRTGTVTIDLVNGNRWVDSGAVLKYTFTNFKVENTCTGKSITINGDRYVTNVFGGNLFRLKNGLVSLLKHKIRTGTSGYQVTFTDSSGSKTAVWNVARNTSITYKSTGNVGYYFEASGDTTIAGIAKTESWGNTRYGNPYQTIFSGAVKANTYCGLLKPTAGTVIHTISSTAITVNYGLNILGNPVGVNDCANFFKVTWLLANGASGNQLFTYYFFMAKFLMLNEQS